MADKSSKPNGPRLARLLDIRISDSDKKVLASLKPDSLTKREEREQLENDDFAQNIRLRREFARKLFKLACWWVLGILGILIANGILSARGLSFLSDAVLLTLIGSTTVNIIGLFTLVVRYLFRSPGR